MTVILNQTKFDVPGLKTVSWRDQEAATIGLKEVTHKSPRSTWVRGIVCHTIHGVLGNLLPGLGPKTTVAEAQARYQVNTDRQVSWDFTCDMNGDWLVQNDPLLHYTWQATSVNGYTCGFEMVQHPNGDLYEDQVAKAVLFVDFLTAKLGIQRQIPWDMKNDCPPKGLIGRIAGPGAGKDVVGVYCHYHQTSSRGPGDPGPWLQKALKDAGYETYAFDGDDDKVVWTERQRSLGLKNPDGVPGPQTLQALKASGHSKLGLWVPRPIDASL